MYIPVIHAAGFNPLGAADKALPAVQFKQIRAFPHVSERFPGGNPTAILPCL